MIRDSRDRRGRVLTQEQKKELRARAKAIKKTSRRESTPAEKMQFAFVVLVIAAIVVIAFKLAS